MRWWSRFWRQRKQDDRVKVKLLFVLAALFFFGSALHTGVSFWKMAGEHAEYILQYSNGTGITDAQMKELEQTDTVSCVSRQVETSVTFPAGVEEVTVSCIELSEEYMKQVLHVPKQHSAMKQFYLNETAYKQLTEKGLSFEEANIQLAYFTMDKEGKRTENMAKISVLKRSLDTEMPYVFCVGDETELRSSSNTLRVETTDQDIDGQQLKQFQQMGYQVINEAERKEEMMRQEVMFFKLRYQLITTFVCGLAAWCLQKWAKTSIA